MTFTHDQPARLGKRKRGSIRESPQLRTASQTVHTYIATDSSQMAYEKVRHDYDNNDNADLLLLLLLLLFLLLLLLLLLYYYYYYYDYDYYYYYYY